MRRINLRQESCVSGTLSAGIDPRLDQLPEHLLAAGSGRAPLAGVPSPADDIVISDVIVQELEVAPAVAAGILDLPADVGDRFALPRHLGGRQTPTRIAGNACVGGAFVEREIPFGVTGAAGHAGDADAAFAAEDRRLMDVHVVAL